MAEQKPTHGYCITKAARTLESLYKDNSARTDELANRTIAVAHAWVAIAAEIREKELADILAFEEVRGRVVQLAGDTSLRNSTV